MATIYGEPGAEKQLLLRCPSDINSYHDVKPRFEILNKTLDERKSIFDTDLPDRINEEKQNLKKVEETKEATEEHWDNKIELINSIISEKPWKLWKYIELFLLKNFKKPKEIKKILKNIKNQKEFIQTLSDNPDSIFKVEHEDLIDEIEQINNALKSPDYRGAYGEIKVLTELEKLDDLYHVFCDASISLKDYVSYKGNRNLKSAQMDFIVAGPTGFFIIEVKNWSDSFKYNHHGLSPYEQLDRAGLVLYIYLKNRFFFYKPPVTKLLVSLKGNFPYNKKYRTVLVKHYKGLNSFITRNNKVIKPSKLEKVVKSLS